MVEKLKSLAKESESIIVAENDQSYSIVSNSNLGRRDKLICMSDKDRFQERSMAFEDLLLNFDRVYVYFPYTWINPSVSPISFNSKKTEREALRPDACIRSFNIK